MPATEALARVAGPDGPPRDAAKGLALAAPALLWTLAFFALPSGAIALWSLFRKDGADLDPSPGLDNYRRFFEQESFRLGWVNSVEVTVLVTVLAVALAFPLAHTIATRIRPERQRLWLMAAVLPFWTSYVVRSYAWLLVLSPDGVVNGTLIALGFTDEPLALSFNRAATVTGFVHFSVMLCTLTIYASLVRIDPKLALAAADLGANRRQILTRVTLPLAAPGIAAGAFLTIVITLGDYITPQILGGNTELLLPQLVLLQIQRRGDIPMAAALSMILMLTVTVAYLALARWLTGRQR